MAGENWYLQVLRDGIEPTHEANTSRYVHEVLTACLDWPFESIVPQEAKRGYIDYKLRFPRSDVGLHVEVKRFRGNLHEEMIRRYVVSRGPLRTGEDLRIGVLTNLAEWRIFAGGPELKELTGDSLCQVGWHEIASRADIAAVRSLIGFRGNGDLREVRAALGEADKVLRGVLLEDDEVIRAIRRELAKIANGHGLAVHVPQRDSIRGYLDLLLDGEWDDDCPFTVAKFRQAVCSQEVAEAIDERLVRRFGSRNRASRIRRTLRQWVDEAGDEN